MTQRSTQQQRESYKQLVLPLQLTKRPGKQSPKRAEILELLVEDDSP
jgi:hypothetical protein